MSNNRVSPRKMVKNRSNMKCSPRKASTRRSGSRTETQPPNEVPDSYPNIKVVVRVRPPNHKEIKNNNRVVVKIDNDVVTFDPKEDEEPFFFHGVQQRCRDLLKKQNKNIEYIFDKVFGFNSNNHEVFTDSTKDLISSVMNGYNCSVFVYGATGAGKTYTMLGKNGSPGLTFLTVEELFTQMRNLSSEREFELGITYLEVYNENVKDLLNPGPPLHLREDTKYGVCVAGIKIHRITNHDELFALLEKGGKHRSQHPTDANAESSRSHAVFQIYVNMKNRSTGQRRIAKLSMIDLAGSERGAATGCKGIRFKEGANINKSLLALGNCINSLADGQRHVPYRDSKLTRLLKDSLGGNCQTVMIANISPCCVNYEDTHNTLKYAMRAKRIKSSVTKNVVSSTLTITQYIKMIEQLGAENEKLKAEISKLKSGTCSCNNEKPEKKDPVWKIQLQSLLKDKINIQKQILRLSNSEDILQYRITKKNKTNSESFLTNLCVNAQQLELGLNRLQNTIGNYEKQLKSIVLQKHDLKQQNDAVEKQLEVIIEKHKLSQNNELLIQSEIDLERNKNEIQKEHLNKFLEVFETEKEQNSKLMIRTSDILNSFYLLLRSSGHLTESVVKDYQSVMRMAQGVRSVTWQMDNEIEVKNQDSGISVNPLVSSISLPSQPVKESPAKVEKPSLEKRTTVKRKLYEVETKSTSAVDDYLKKYLINTDKETELNETITITNPINVESLNNTFSLHNKEPARIAQKKPGNITNGNLTAKANKSVAAKNQMTENPKTINNKFFSTLSKSQRFPLRNGDSVNQNRMDSTTTRSNIKKFKS